MSGMDEGPPPEVPEEYAAVYRDAYRRALDEAGEEPAGDELIPMSTAPRGPSPTRFGPLLVGGLVVLLVCVVLGVSLISGDDDPAAESPTSTVPTKKPAPSKAPSKSAKPKPPKPSPSATIGPGWDGPVTPVALDQVAATCTGSPSVDSAGQRVEYVAANAIDSDPTTAWRCDGLAIGETLTLTLPGGTEVGEVGLIPGYAKKDPVSGADRFVENNRVTKVRWTFEDGSEVVQELDPADRTVQRLRVPRTASGTVTLEILAVERGTRNRTAISEIEVASAG